MVNDDDQKTADSSTGEGNEGNAEESVANVIEDVDKVVEQRPSSTNASQPGELQNDEEAEETQEEEKEKSAEDLRTLEEELDKITVSAPTLYAVLVFRCLLWKLEISVVLHYVTSHNSYILHVDRSGTL